MTGQENKRLSANRALLEERLSKLDQKNFDWTAWKKGTLLVLEKIFGKDSLYVKELINTDYHYNSWSLRDTAGSEDPVKAGVRELLYICLTEVEHSQPGNVPPSAPSNKDEMKELVKQFLDDATLAKISKIARADSPDIAKEEQVQKIISEKIDKYQTILLGKILLWVNK
jgi:hypothetical protein